MAYDSVAYEELGRVRDNLIKLIKQRLTKNDKEFLVSFKMGEPKWPLLGDPRC